MLGFAMIYFLLKRGENLLHLQNVFRLTWHQNIKVLLDFQTF
jgi:hypothetical protein